MKIIQECQGAIPQMNSNPPNMIPMIISRIEQLISEYEQEPTTSPKNKWKADGITSGLSMALDITSYN